MRRSGLWVAIVLTAAGCSSLEGPAVPPLGAELYLRLAYSNAGIAMILSVYEGGTLRFDSVDGKVFAAHVDKEDLTELETALRSHEVQSGLKSAAAEHFEARYFDYEELEITVGNSDAVHVPFVRMPESLFPLIRAMDALFVSAFGKKYSRRSLAEDIPYMRRGR